MPRANRKKKRSKKAKQKKEEVYVPTPVEPKPNLRPRKPKAPFTVDAAVDEEANTRLFDAPLASQRKPTKFEFNKEKLEKNMREYRQRFSSARIQRALNQRMYLLEAEELEHGSWEFQVEGSRGTPYRIDLNPLSSQCTCPDFRTHKFNQDSRPCKHIYFIIFRVAGALDLEEQLAHVYYLTTKQYLSMTERLRNRLTIRIKPPQLIPENPSRREPEPSLGEDCAICFEQLTDNNSLKSCHQCRNQFHSSCLQVWMNKNASCPLCRTDLSKLSKKVSDLLEVDQIQNDSPLNKLKKVRLG